MLTIEPAPQAQAPDTGRDRLDMKYINSLPQPLWDGEWPVHDIDVETGLYRIDVCGLLEVRHIDRCFTMKDAAGKIHYVGDFELDPDQWEERALPDSKTPNVSNERATPARAEVKDANEQASR